ncbi:hypothetical protein REPUB_Repub12eG0064900 [Reevesia pubescens]
MGPLLHYYMLKCLFFLVLPHLLIQCCSSMQPLCRNSERSALLQLKENFILNQSASKVGSWKLEGDCSLWDGVECDDNTGHVIGLDLSSSFLYGSIDSNSSLFCLSHLRRLNLSDNDFNYSKIPSALGSLSRLSRLELSSSAFSGQIPAEVFELSKLVTLDLSDNYLELQNPSLKSLAEKLVYLRHLNLDKVNVSSAIPQSLANLSSLTYLSLGNCELHGEFPIKVFHLPNLQILNVDGNPFLTGHFPEFNRSSSIEILELGFTGFLGELPKSIGNLESLSYSGISKCHFTGRIPTSLANLTHLTYLSLPDNKFYGPIPQSIFTNLVNLEHLYLYQNHLIGTIKLESFLNLKKLKSLYLSSNDFSLISTATPNLTVPKFYMLGLSSCNLSKFPDFLADQDELEFLDLSGNKIDGHIPYWLWGLSAKTLEFLYLDVNFLTGFDQPPIVLLWTNLRILDLRYNNLQGSLPIPSASMYQYFVSNNLLTGEISPVVCNLSSIIVLDMSSNNFSGKLPPCLVNLSRSLSILNLQNNSFRGRIPQTCKNGSKLRMIDFSQNQLYGPIPRSMVYCSMLESLNLGNNQMNGTFPSQLGTLPELKVLILQHNGFHGAIGKPETNDFPKLRILDLSFNQFEGSLPSQYFPRWKAMKFADSHELRYLQANTSFQVPGYDWSSYVSYSRTMTNKGVETTYEKIQEFLVTIDLSSNRFEGCIPEDIQILEALQFLNLSNNFLSGPIPSSLATLMDLQSLDLSQNKLSGEIPQELPKLTFLEFFNVSNNQLIGPMPQGKQFGTFENNSFEGNPGLCGNPLSKKCYSSSPPPPLL